MFQVNLVSIQNLLTSPEEQCVCVCVCVCVCLGLKGNRTVCVCVCVCLGMKGNRKNASGYTEIIFETHILELLCDNAREGF